MDATDQQMRFLSTLLHLEKRFRDAENVQELNYRLANETLNLVQYDQLIVWQLGRAGRISIEVVSGIDRLVANTPFVHNSKKIIAHLRKTRGMTESVIPVSELTPDITLLTVELQWQYLLWIPFGEDAGSNYGGMLAARKEQQWTEQETTLFGRISEAVQHARKALSSGKKIAVGSRGRRLLGYSLLVAAIALMLYPVRLSVLAPAEVIPAQSVLITSPMDGIVSSFRIQPNQRVRLDQPLVTLDKTALSNQYAVAQKTFEVVKARYEHALQRSFIDQQAREQIHLLKAQMEQKMAETDYVKSQLDKTTILSPAAGIAVFKDEDDWLGRPVATGQKILTIAAPDQVELEIMLPAGDAITFDRESPISFFLNVAPTRPLSATIYHVGYRAIEDGTGGLAFPIKAGFDQFDVPPRIGLRGTAKIYGKKVTLIYAILRRPLTKLRQMVGW